MKFLIWKTLAVAVSVFLAGCGGGGGGSGEVVIVSVPPPFVFWSGSSGGDRVIDGLGHQFAFRSGSGCLYNFQTGQDNSAFCLVPGTNVVTYGSFQGRVANVLVTDGTCHAAIIDSFTGNFNDIEIDAYGREIVFVTQLHPALCV